MFILVIYFISESLKKIYLIFIIYVVFCQIIPKILWSHDMSIITNSLLISELQEQLDLQSRELILIFQGV